MTKSALLVLLLALSACGGSSAGESGGGASTSPASRDEAACVKVLAEAYKQSQDDPNYEASEETPKECVGFSDEEILAFGAQVMASATAGS